ncbi:hypothetical protein ACNAW0_13960 [Micromonospora sp. SL1-18]|uniref:hypothetical protein n=1 Tax=Micromonospora sp. SL1-18 TaxID=3399128 RepID=UPI003A4E425E
MIARRDVLRGAGSLAAAPLDARVLQAEAGGPAYASSGTGRIDRRVRWEGLAPAL